MAEQFIHGLLNVCMSKLNDPDYADKSKKDFELFYDSIKHIDDVEENQRIIEAERLRELEEEQAKNTSNDLSNKDSTTNVTSRADN